MPVQFSTQAGLPTPQLHPQRMVAQARSNAPFPALRDLFPANYLAIVEQMSAVVLYNVHARVLMATRPRCRLGLPVPLCPPALVSQSLTLLSTPRHRARWLLPLETRA